MVKGQGDLVKRLERENPRDLAFEEADVPSDEPLESLGTSLGVGTV